VFILKAYVCVLFLLKIQEWRKYDGNQKKRGREYAGEG